MPWFYPQLQRHESRLQAVEMRYLRRVQEVSRLDRVRNEGVQQVLKQDAVLDVVKAKQNAWREKLEKMDDERQEKRVYACRRSAGEETKRATNRDGMKILISN